MNLLKCNNLTKKYGKKEALSNVNLEINSGRIIGLLGKNGAGKTTLIKLINDILTPTSGEILFKGNPIGVESKKHISYLSDVNILDKNDTPSKMIKFYKDFFEDFDESKAEKLFGELGLDLNLKFGKMSKGMIEKSNLILAISRQADLYILDEPIAGVDPASRDHILETILSNFNENASLVISTHLIADVEKILDDVIFIDDGKIILTSDADELREKENASIDDIFRRMFKW